MLAVIPGEVVAAQTPAQATPGAAVVMTLVVVEMATLAACEYTHTPLLRASHVCAPLPHCPEAFIMLMMMQLRSDWPLRPRLP